MTIMKIASRRIAGLLVSSLIAALFGGAVMAKELKLADFLPPTHPYQKQVYGVLGDKISKATNGEITLKVFPAGALGGNPLEQYNRALNGVADITFGLPGYTASKFPMTLMSELPGVLDEVTATDKVWENIDLIKDIHFIFLFISFKSSFGNSITSTFVFGQHKISSNFLSTGMALFSLNVFLKLSSIFHLFNSIYGSKFSKKWLI